MNNQSKEDLVAVLQDAQDTDKFLAVSVTDGSGYARNALIWPATEAGLEAAQEYARDLFSRWMAAREWRLDAVEKREHDALQAA